MTSSCRTPRLFVCQLEYNYVLAKLMCYLTVVVAAVEFLGLVDSVFVFVCIVSCGGRSIRCVVVSLSFGVVVHRTVIGVLSTNIVSLSCGLGWLRCLVVVRL